MCSQISGVCPCCNGKCLHHSGDGTISCNTAVRKLYKNINLSEPLKATERTRQTIQLLRAGSGPIIVVPAKGRYTTKGTCKNTLVLMFTLVDTRDLLTAAVSYRTYANLQKFYLHLSICSYQSPENKPQSHLFI